MEKVIISPFVVNKLESLILVLFENEYFGFMESAMDYVDNIYDFILSIPSEKKKRTKKSKFGNWYCSYKANRKTTYFITFDYERGIYLIKNITNNHSSDYPSFIKSIK